VGVQLCVYIGGGGGGGGICEKRWGGWGGVC